MKIGVLRYRFSYYPYTRNIVGKLPEVTYVPVEDVFSFLNRGGRKVNRWLHREIVPVFDLNNVFFDAGLNKVNMLHFFNGVSFGKTPWVSTFETVLPRLQFVFRKMRGGDWSGAQRLCVEKFLKAISSPACRAILPLSQNAAGFQRRLLSWFPDWESSVEQKMIVLPPPQPVLVDRWEDKRLRLEKLHLLFVGASFFRKGGKEMLQALAQLRAEGWRNFDLTLVSSLRMDFYAAHETLEDLQWTRNFISQNRAWLHYIPQCSNQEVLDLMRKAHLGLLPTYADTYGYVVLEFFASGCPVITTDVRALSEINDETRGWLINVPKDDLGEAIYQTTEGRHQVSRAIRTGLKRILRGVLDSPNSISQKGMNAIRYIRKNHDPQAHAQALREIYYK